MSQSTTAAPTIPGYDIGTTRVTRSPVRIEELRELEETVQWTEDDAAILARVGKLLEDQAEHVVDSWRSVIAAQPHLAQWFVGSDGHPDEEYKARVKRRFVQWVLDVFFRPHDQAWLDYQDEIGKRHTPLKKNLTDGAKTPDVVPLRYTVAFSAVVITTIREFAADKGIAADDLSRFQNAWTKAVLLQLALWTRAYAKDGQW